MKIYISGPITHNPDWQKHFSCAEQTIRKNGDMPLNPAIWDKENIQLEYEEYMKLDLCMVEIADAILMLPGWEKSLGARLEHEKAIELNKQIIYGEVKNEQIIAEQSKKRKAEN